VNNSIIKFDEVLNDLMDYFILGDPDLLLKFKEDNNLPDDLITEFTTQTSVDDAVEQGVLVPICGVENHPYTIYFNLLGDDPVLSQQENQLIHRQDGYCLHIANERLYLYTIRYLGNYTAKMTEALKRNKNFISLSNGWYCVSVLAGLVMDGRERKPAFEFIICPKEERPDYSADYLYRFTIQYDY